MSARLRPLLEDELERFRADWQGGNEVARNLYRSLGYEEFSVWMGKDVE